MARFRRGLRLNCCELNNIKDHIMLYNKVIIVLYNLLRSQFEIWFALTLIIVTHPTAVCKSNRLNSTYVINIHYEIKKKTRIKIILHVLFTIYINLFMNK